MPESDSLDRIFRELESIRAQLRSMIESINSNEQVNGQRLTALEVYRESHGKEVALMVSASDGKFLALQTQANTNTSDIKSLVDTYNQAKGSLKTFGIIGGVASLALVILNIWHIFSGHTP